MKIAIGLEYPIGQFGGTEVLVQELVRGLAGRHQLILVSNDTPEAIAASSWKPLLAGHIPWVPAKLNHTTSHWLAEELVRHKVDLAHFHFGGNYGWGNRSFSLCPVVQAARRGVPCLSTNHGAFSILDGYCGAQRPLAVKLALLPAAWLSKQFVLQKLFCEVTVSQNDLRNVRCWYPPMRHQFRQIYHSRLHGSPPPAVPERAKQIVSLGTIGPRKGQTFLAEAFCKIAAAHPGWKLIIAGRHGDAGMTQQIKQLRAASGLEDRIVLQERVTDAEAEQLLRTSAIFAMPSLAEGLGLSLQEALFNGCACLASRAGGMQDLIQHEDNGLLAEPADVISLAAALERLIADEALRRRFGAHGAASVLKKEMTAEQMVGKYEALYRECLEQPR